MMRKSILPDSLGKLLISLGLAGLTLLVYSRTFNYPFIDYDDPDYVAENPFVQAGLTPGGVRWAFTSLACGNWHPLTWLSLQLDASLQKSAEAGAFHRTNVFLHSANTLLLFLVVARMTRMVWRSAVVAALFALHPLHVESVAWVAERKDVLSTMFWLLTLAAYLRYVQCPCLGRYMPVLLLFALGLLAKPMLVTLPLALLLLDYWPLGRLPMADSLPRSRFEGEGPVISPPPSSLRGGAKANLQFVILEKIPLFALALVSCMVTVRAQIHGNAVASFEVFPLTARLENALLAYLAYLCKLAWPMHLAVFYPHHGGAVSLVQALGAGLVVVALTWLVLGPGRRWPYLAIGWLWYLVTLVPVIGLVQVGAQAMADRYTYLPSIGLFLLFTWGAADLVSAWGWPRACAVGATAAVLFVCGSLTWVQIGYWKSPLDLWEHAATVTTGNVLAYIHVGNRFEDQGRLAAAKRAYDAAAAINPQLAEPHVDLGNVLAELGLAEGALAEYRRAIALKPSSALAHNNLANLLRELGRPEEAVTEYERALELDPHPGTCVNLGVALSDLGRSDQAADAYRRAIAIDSENAPAHQNLAIALMDLGRTKEALQEFRWAIQLDGRMAEPHTNLGRALQEEGRLEEAAAEYEQARALGDKQAESLLKACRRFQALRPRLSGVSAGCDQPADNEQRLALADLCRQRYVRRYGLAAHLYRDAFRADSKLAEDPSNRFKAAVVYAAAGFGLGLDPVPPIERSDLRRQALGWLRADLANLSKRARISDPPTRAALRRSLQAWQHDACLAAIRVLGEPAEQTREERINWHKLWQDLDEALEENARS
jgi:tetratricopeptide (TPR) repeat protein